MRQKTEKPRAWHNRSRRFFWHFRAFIYASSLSLQKITRTNQTRKAQKKRDAVRQSPFKRAGGTLYVF